MNAKSAGGSLSVDKAIHGLCPLERPQETPRVSWVAGRRILLGQTCSTVCSPENAGDATATASASSVRTTMKPPRACFVNSVLPCRSAIVRRMAVVVGDAGPTLLRDDLHVEFPQGGDELFGMTAALAVEAEYDRPALHVRAAQSPRSARRRAHQPSPPVAICGRLEADHVTERNRQCRCLVFAVFLWRRVSAISLVRVVRSTGRGSVFGPDRLASQREAARHRGRIQP